MSGLPVISGHDAVTARRKLGYEVVRQRGSHLRLRHPTDSARAPITVPDHKELKSGTLRSIICDAGMSVAEFAALLDRRA